MSRSGSVPGEASSDWFAARGRVVRCDRRPLLMGIVNVTADSFYDGGRYARSEQAVAHALDLVEQGADILDIGGESTRPGATPIDEEVELAHVIPVVAELARRTPVPISIDTTKAEVARRGLDCGASIINDVSALRWDPAMASIIARAGAAVVLMHMQGTPQTMQQSPQYDDVVRDVRQFLQARLQVALEAGISRSNIILDPGFGFGKLVSHNLVLLRQLSSLSTLGCPLLVGLSRKGFIGQIIDRPVQDREWGTAAAVALAVERGAKIIRVHDVAMMADVVKLTVALDSQWVTHKQVHDA